jgi:antitoxin Phd
MQQIDTTMPVVGVTEAKAHFSQLTREVNMSGQAVTVFKNNRPWVVISPAHQDFRIGDSDTLDVMDEADRRMGTTEGTWYDNPDQLFDALGI